MSVYLNTYKVTVEATVQAESEDEAKARIANLLNNTNALNTGGFNNTNTRVAGINKIEVDMEQENEAGKEQNTKQNKLNKLAAEQAKELQKQGLQEIPDEVVVRDPDTGSNVVVRNPEKAKQQEQLNKQQEKEEEKESSPQQKPQTRQQADRK